MDNPFAEENPTPPKRKAKKKKAKKRGRPKKNPDLPPDDRYYRNNTENKKKDSVDENSLDYHLKSDPPNEETKIHAKPFLYGLNPNNFTQDELLYIIASSDRLIKFSQIPSAQTYLRQIVQIDIQLRRHEMNSVALKRNMDSQQLVQFEIRQHKHTDNLMQAYKKACDAIGLDPKNEVALFDNEEKDSPLSDLLIRYASEIKRMHVDGETVGAVSSQALALAKRKAMSDDHTALSDEKISEHDPIGDRTRLGVVDEFEKQQNNSFNAG